jgi:hypothetical protein
MLTRYLNRNDRAMLAHSQNGVRTASAYIDTPDTEADYSVAEVSISL